jgi:hypothetical protein
MPTRRISFGNFDRKIWLSGGRDQMPADTLRRATGVSATSVNSITSRWGSQLKYNRAAVSLYRYNNHDFVYTGTQLYQDNTLIKSSFNGARLTFVSMPPQPGQPDYLFILGGGVTPFKISPSGVISNWGIQPPRDGMQALVGPTDALSIDTFVNSAVNWTPINAVISDNAAIPPFGDATNSLLVAPSNTQQTTWYLTRTYGSVQNFAYYGDGRASLQSDLMQFYVWLGDPTKILYLSLQFDVNDGTFTDFYQANVQFVPGTVDPGLAGGIQQVVQADGGRWTQVAIAKSQFIRLGGHLNLDWNTVKAIRIQGGLPYGGVGAFVLGFQNLKMTGSYALGAGPAASRGGSVYLYQVTYGNETTGSDSNPNLQPAVANAVAEGPVTLSKIPVSTDPQVGNRKLWRSSALPPGSVSGPLFFLDKIADNTTTTYTDVTADLAIPFTATAWVASATFILNQLIDAGNGWLMKCTVAGTTGATQPPWNVPGGYWIPLETNFTVGDQIFDVASGFVMQCTQTGLTGNVVPNFASLAVGGSLTDGTVKWTRIAAPTTADNSVTWTFAGINSPPVLGNQEVLLDNAAPDPTVGDAAGPWQNSMVWSRVANFPGDVFISPPGRPESFGGAQIHVSTSVDPMQKVVTWDTFLWGLSTQKNFNLAGTFPAITPVVVDDAGGTNAPYSVVSVRRVGIIYAGQDGIRKFNNAGIEFIGFEQLAPILNGASAEGIGPFEPTIAFETRFGEVVFTDFNSETSLALSFELFRDHPSWRDMGIVIAAGYFERDTGSVLASFNARTYLLEEPGQFTDGGTAIPFEIQSPGDMATPSAEFQTQRLYLTAQLNGQTLTPVLIVDGVEYTLPILVGTGRKTFELPKQITGRLFDGVRLTGSLTAQVEVYSIFADLWYGEVAARRSLTQVEREA